MEQHPIPQNVSSYQFKLVGDMTLKQFFQLAGGFVVALIFYSAPIIGIIKWPFVIVSAILGVALAFLPLEERPLEKWIFAFFRAIYAPTEFMWKKTTTPVKFYQAEPAAVQTPVGPQQAAINEYLTATPEGASTAKLEGGEKGFLTALTGIVSGLVTSATGGPIQQTVPVGTQPLAAPQGQQAPMPTAVAPAEVKKEISIPETAPIRIERAAPAKLVVEEKAPIPQGAQITTQQVAPTIAGEEIVSTKQAIFSVDAAPPNPPTVPNVVVGQVVDQDRRIVEGAIMEIRDSGGRPIRALRSNKVGHFITVTPLEEGRYDVITEKEGYQFVPVTFEASGQIIPPILVQGRRMDVPAIAQVPAVQVSTVSANNTIQANVSTF